MTATLLRHHQSTHPLDPIGVCWIAKDGIQVSCNLDLNGSGTGWISVDGHRLQFECVRTYPFRLSTLPRHSCRNAGARTACAVAGDGDGVYRRCVRVCALEPPRRACDRRSPVRVRRPIAPLLLDSDETRGGRAHMRVSKRALTTAWNHIRTQPSIPSPRFKAAPGEPFDVLTYRPRKSARLMAPSSFLSDLAMMRPTNLVISSLLIWPSPSASRNWKDRTIRRLRPSIQSSLYSLRDNWLSPLLSNS